MGYFISLVVLAIFLLILRIKNKNLTIAKDRISELGKDLAEKKRTIENLEYDLERKRRVWYGSHFLEYFSFSHGINDTIKAVEQKHIQVQDGNFLDSQEEVL